MNKKQNIITYIQNMENTFGKRPTCEMVAKAFQTTPEEIKRILSEKEKPPKRKRIFNFNAELVIRAVMFFISTSAIIISIHYSRFWLLNFLEPVKASLLAGIMVLYMTFAVEGVSLLRKQKRHVVAGIIAITGFIVMLFSMVSTVAGQYNKMSENLVVHKDAYELSIHEDEQETLKETISLLQENLRNTDKRLATMDEDDRLYTTVFWENYRIKKDLDKYLEELQETRKAILETSKSENVVIEKEERQDFYFFVGKLFGVQKNLAEFLLFMFPAVFIDIICPLGMYVALGLYKKEE